MAEVLSGLLAAVELVCPECEAVGRWWIVVSILVVLYWIASGIYWSLHFALFHANSGLYDMCVPWTWMYPIPVVSGEVYSMTYVCGRISLTMFLHVIFGVVAALAFPLLLPVIVLERILRVVMWCADMDGQLDDDDEFEDKEASADEAENKSEMPLEKEE